MKLFNRSNEMTEPSEVIHLAARLVRGAAAALAALSMLPLSAQAATSFGFTGAFDTVYFGSSAMPVLVPLTGSLMIGGNATPLSDDGTKAVYPLISVTASVTYAGSTLALSAPAGENIAILNDAGGGAPYDGVLLSGTLVDPRASLDFTVDLRGPSTLWESTALPGALNLALFDSYDISGALTVFLPTGNQTALVSGELTSLAAVPVPAATWLFGSAMVMFGSLRRRSHKA